MRIELHCHTVHSWDGYSTIDSLIDECVAKRIDAIALTEHDRLADLAAAEQRGRARGITLIPACEVTTDNGAHIIGLFLKELPRQAPAADVIRAIREQQGLVSIPHPFKPRSGLLAIPGVEPDVIDAVLRDADFIELHNGGFDQTPHARDIERIAAQHGLRCIAASDAHKPWHVGMFVTELACNSTSNLRELREAMRTASVTGLFRASEFQPRSKEEARRRPRPALLQAAIDQVPMAWKRTFHLRKHDWLARGYRPNATTYVRLGDA